MKLLLSDIFNSQDVFQKISNTPDLPFKTSYRVSKILLKLQDEVKILHDKRNELIKKHGSVKEDGTPEILPNDPKLKDFIKEFQEVLDTETDVDVSQFTPDLLENAKLTPGDILRISKFISEKEGSKTKEATITDVKETIQ